jgi:hypothetical protein
MGIKRNTQKNHDRAVHTVVNQLTTLANELKDIVGGVLTGSATWDPASLADGAGETSSGITVTGAALGDFVLVSAPYDLQGITCNGYVSAANTVKIRLQNETGGAIDLASGTWRAAVIPQATFITATSADADTLV